MGTGYVRADSTNAIANGKLIDADVFDNEFDAIVAAFDSSTGHTHDGTSAEGAPVTVLGPAQETIQDGTALYPKADGIYDLGKSTQEWKDAYIDGVAYIDTLDLAGTQVTSIDTDLSSVSASDDTLASAKAIKTYVDALVTAQDLDFQADTGGALNIDLDSETLTIAGGTGIDTSGSGNTVTVAIDSTVATLTGTQTLANKSIDLASNTLAGSLAQFNAALSDADFASIAGTETLTNKTVNLSNNTLLGTTAEFNTALSDGSFATLAGTETLTNKTLTSPVVGGSPDFSGAANKDTILSDLGGTATGISVFKATDQSAARSSIGLGDLATLNTVDTSQVDDGAITTAKLASGEQMTASNVSDAYAARALDEIGQMRLVSIRYGNGAGNSYAVGSTYAGSTWGLTGTWRVMGATSVSYTYFSDEYTHWFWLLKRTA